MGWSEGFLEAPHDHVFVRRLGDVDDGAAPVVLLHGFSDSGECWMPLVPFVASRGVVVLPDARGHGRSRVPHEPVSIDALADDAAAVVASLGRPAVVLGHSMGADTAARLGERHAELVVAIVLEDPPWRTTGPDEHPELVDQLVAAWIDDLQSHREDELVDRCRRENPAWGPEELGPWARSKLAFDRAFLAHPQPWRFRPWQDAAASLPCPTLLLTGEQRLGAIVSPETAAETERRQARLRHVAVAGAGHCIRRDQPAAYLAAVTAFLDELGPAA